MAKANWTANQPTNLNYLSPVNFDLSINKLPKTRYFCTAINIPTINMSETTHDTTLAIQSHLPGDKITFDPLNVKFVVDEDMTNYKEIFNWIMALGPGYDTDDYVALVEATKTGTNKFSNAKYENMYSDALLIT